MHSGRTLRRSLTQVCAGHSGTELFRFPVTIRHSVGRCRLIAFEQRVTARSAPATTVRASAPTCSQEPPGRLPAQGNSSACMPMSSAHSWEPTRPKLQLVIVPAAFCVLCLASLVSEKVVDSLILRVCHLCSRMMLESTIVHLAPCLVDPAGKARLCFVLFYPALPSAFLLDIS